MLLVLAREHRPSYWISCIIAGTKRMPSKELESPSIAGCHQDLVGGVWSFRNVKIRPNIPCTPMCTCMSEDFLIGTSQI